MRTWLEVVDFDYPLTWNNASRSFRSFVEQTNKLLVVEVQNQVKYLSAENAELVFGIQYDGLPTLNIANAGFNAIDEKTGAIQAFTDATLGPAREKITDGLKAMDDLLETDLHKFLKIPFDKQIQPGISNLYEQARTAYLANPGNWQTDITGLVNTYFTGTGQNYFRNRFFMLMGNAGSDLAVLSRVDEDLIEAGPSHWRGPDNSREHAVDGHPGQTVGQPARFQAGALGG